MPKSPILGEGVSHFVRITKKCHAYLKKLDLRLQLIYDDYIL